MKYLRKKNPANKNLIVFFSGWGAGEDFFKHAKSEGFDVLVFFDYRNLELPKFDFSKYEKKYLVAWSMGVFLSSIMKEDFVKKIAINGTNCPIHDDFGIKQSVFNLTLNNFNDETYEKFMQNAEIPCKTNRSTEELKEELLSIKNFKSNSMPHNFEKAIISKNDRIFTFKNQENYWQKQKNTEIVIKNWGHYPLFKAWSEILND